MYKFTRLWKITKFMGIENNHDNGETFYEAQIIHIT